MHAKSEIRYGIVTRSEASRVQQCGGWRRMQNSLPYRINHNFLLLLLRRVSFKIFMPFGNIAIFRRSHARHIILFHSDTIFLGLPCSLTALLHASRCKWCEHVEFNFLRTSMMDTLSASTATLNMFVNHFVVANFSFNCFRLAAGFLSHHSNKLGTNYSHPYDVRHTFGETSTRIMCASPATR